MPDVKMNRISLCALNSLGWRYIFEGRTLRALCDSSVMLSGKLMNDLYLPRGNTIVIDASISVESSSVDDDQSIRTNVFHVLIGKFRVLSELCFFTLFVSVIWGNGGDDNILNFDLLFDKFKLKWRFC